jgi:hypothetical protein
MAKGRLPNREEVGDEGEKTFSNPNKDELKTRRQPCGRDLSKEENRKEIK